jgi:acetolactate synthase-1/2/3 large subunit
VRIEKPKEVGPAVKAAFKSKTTTVLDIKVAHEENIFPMVPPGKCLKDIIE